MSTARPSPLILELAPRGGWVLGPAVARKGPRLFARRAEAEAHARAEARRTGAELVIRGDRGRVVLRSSQSARGSRYGPASSG